MTNKTCDKIHKFEFLQYKLKHFEIEHNFETLLI